MDASANDTFATELNPDILTDDLKIPRGCKLCGIKQNPFEN
jgi:hypothetical protein